MYPASSSGTCSGIQCETPSSTLKSNGPVTHRPVSSAARRPMAMSSVLQTYVVGTVIAPVLCPAEMSRGMARYQASAPASAPGSLVNRSTYTLATSSLSLDPPMNVDGWRRADIDGAL